MDFSDSIPCTASPAFSPNQRYFATSQDYRLTVRHCDSLQVEAVYSCLDRIDEIAWSPDSDHVLCGLFKRATVQVFSISDPEWTCSIAEGPAGILAARWAPGGQHILLTCDFQVRLSVWSLVDQSCIYLRGPKYAHAGLHFSPDGSMLAVAMRSNCKDVLTIYECASWAVVAQFGVATQDLADLAWSPDGSCLAVWDSPAYSYTVAIYNPEGECLTSYQAYSEGLGVKTLAWSPSGQLLAVGSFDQEVRVLNHVTWNPLACFAHSSTVSGPATVVAYSEMEEDTGRRLSASQQENQNPQQPATQQQQGKALSRAASGRTGLTASRIPSFSRPRPGNKPASRQSSPVKGAAAGGEEGSGDMVITKSRYVVAELPHKLQTLRAPQDKPNPKLGVGCISWSHDGSYVLTRCDSMPSAVWVWDTSRLELAAVLTQTQAVKCAEWDPASNRLAVCTGSTKVYLWSPEGASCVHIPLPGFRAASLRWHPAGTCLLLADKEAVCCAYLG